MNSPNLKGDVFCYAVPVQTILTTATNTPSIVFNSDSEFILHEIRATKQAIGAITMFLTKSSGENLQNVALDTRLFAEDNFPVRLPAPVRFGANDVLNVALTNTTGGTLTTQIQFWGIIVRNNKG